MTRLAMIVLAGVVAALTAAGGSAGAAWYSIGRVTTMVHVP